VEHGPAGSRRDTATGTRPTRFGHQTATAPGRRPTWPDSTTFHGQPALGDRAAWAVTWLGRLAGARSPTCCLRDSRGSPQSTGACRPCSSGRVGRPANALPWGRGPHRAPWRPCATSPSARCAWPVGQHRRCAATQQPRPNPASHHPRHPIRVIGQLDTLPGPGRSGWADGPKPCSRRSPKPAVDRILGRTRQALHPECGEVPRGLAIGEVAGGIASLARTAAMCRYVWCRRGPYFCRYCRGPSPVAWVNARRNAVGSP
jgi:hypothetical protein